MNQDRRDHCPVPLAPRTRSCRLDDGGMLLQAPAKINLNLLVASSGADGFHPLDSMVAKVTLYDSIELRPRSDGQIVLVSSGCDCGPPEQNLVMRAAQLIGSGSDHCGVDIKLTKLIPAGSGLGGGSSDAASTLRGLNEMWELGLDAVQINVLAAQLGSDVPLFLGPPAVRITGRGEFVEPLEVSEFSAVILTGPLMCSTSEVYGLYDQLDVTESRQLEAGLFSQGPPSLWRGSLRNDLTQAAERVCGELKTLKNRVQSAVDIPVHLSGSGSALFILCDDSSEAQAVVAGLDDDLQDMCVIVGCNPW
ncbi:MAG: 4-(cytidine 5'-diphospho)-2-C-methyl-D-erythritol kinase [bacterium]|nr:4-(cytidine 5'-diphospho)-2-C-methyl-D-erythritol kinase [bacterium]